MKACSTGCWALQTQFGGLAFRDDKKIGQQPSKAIFLHRSSELSGIEAVNLRIYADFNSVSGDGWCWCLRFNGKLLDDIAGELKLSEGQRVVLFYQDPSEEFELDAVLSLRDGRWQAKYDESSYRLLRDDSNKFSE